MAAAAAMMEAQTLPFFAWWPVPQSLASRHVTPASSSALCVIARRCLPMDRRGVRQLARRGAAGCLWRTPLRAAAGGAVARRERALRMLRAYMCAPVWAVCESREP